MARNNDVRRIVDLFKLYYQSVNKLSDYSFVVDEKTDIRIKNFCTWIRELTGTQIQDGYVNQYFEFQFNRHYKKRGIRGGRGKGSGVKLAWIICKKSFDEWKKIEDKNKNLEFYKVRKNFKTDVTIIRKQYKENWDDHFININRAEEMEKLVAFDTKESLAWCSEFTYLFNDKSDICFVCKFKNECKEKLKLKYPHIFKIRGYV